MKDEKYVSILPLRCNNCSANLKALEDDVVFFCPSCQVCWELREDRFIQRSLLVVKKEIDTPPKLSQSFYLPFWYIEKALIIPAFLSTGIIKMAKFFTKLTMENSDVEIPHLFGASLYSWEVAELADLVDPKFRNSKELSFDVAAIPFAIVDGKLIDLIKGQIFYQEHIDNFAEIFQRSTKNR